MNPYQCTLHTTELGTRRRVVRNAMFFGGVTGAFVWFTLFLAVGFHSDFGNKLTRLYGRDLTNANYDWMIFAAIIVVATTLSFTVSGIVTRRFAGILKTGDTSNGFSRIYLILIPPATILLIVAWVCRFIDTPLARPVAYSVLAAACCSWAFSSAIIAPDLESSNNRG